MKKQILQFAKAAGIFAAATALLLLFPVVSALYIPVCIAVFAALNLCETSWQKFVLLIIGFFANLILSNSLIFPILCVVLPFVFAKISAFFFKKDMPEKTLTLIFGIANALFFVVVLFFSKGETGGIDGIMAQMEQTFNQNIDLLVQQGIIDLELKESYIAQMQFVLNQAKLLAPSLLFIFSAVSGYVTLWAVWLFSMFLRSDFCYKPCFSKFKCNTVTSGMTILVCILSVFIKDGVFGVALDNAFAIFSFLLCVCAASLADFWLKGKNWVTIVRIIIVLFLLSNYSGSILSLILCLIAISDARADFRRLER